MAVENGREYYDKGVRSPRPWSLVVALAEVPELFSDWYDSVRQRAMVVGQHSGIAEALGPALRCEVLGQMRWDAIRSPRRLQSYAQLLDGWVMHLLANDRLVSEIGVPDESGHLVLPFEVANYAFSLESSLVEIAHRSFLFSSLPYSDHRRLALQARLAEFSSAEVERRIERDGVAAGIAGLLRDSGASAEDSHRLATTWNFWIDMERRGVLTTRQAQPLCDDADSFAAEEYATMALRTAHGRRVRDHVLSDATRDPVSGARRRSLVYAQIARLQASNISDEKADADMLKVAFNRCYHRTIARSEGAMLSLHDAGAGASGLRRRVAEQEARQRQLVVFPTGYIDLLGGMSADRWQEFTASIGTELREWWRTWDLDALQAIGHRLTAERYPDLPAAQSDRSRRYLTAFATVAAGSGGAFADPNLTGVLIGGGIGVLAWVITDPVADLISTRVRCRQQRFDLVEVWTGPSGT